MPRHPDTNTSSFAVRCGTFFSVIQIPSERFYGKLYLTVLFTYEIDISPKRDVVTGQWRKFRSGELHNLYSQSVIRQIKSRRMGWAGHVARMGEGRNGYRILVGKPEGKRPLGRPRRRWEEGIKVGLREIGRGVWNGFNWVRTGTVGGLL
jgi:hypothetical protein